MMSTKKSAKKYRNTITFIPQNSNRIRVRQKRASFSRTVNEDLNAYYHLLDCMSIDMRGFFTPPKWQYYCDCLSGADIYKHTPWAYARAIGRALEDGALNSLDTKYGVDAKALAQEARDLSILEAAWIYDRVQKCIPYKEMNYA